MVKLHLNFYLCPGYPYCKFGFAAGFEAPDDKEKWRNAQIQAATGKLVLLEQVLKVIKNPFEFVSGDKKFRWVHRIADVRLNRKMSFEAALKNFTGIQ